jgi:glycosyltransferase involved in cell wall biosynthesis
VLASDWSRRAGKPHVVQLVGSDVTLLSEFRESGVALGWDEWVHAVACNSDALARDFLALYPNARNVRTVRRGVDLHRFHPDGPAAGPIAGRPSVRYLFLGGFPAYTRLPHGANTKGGMTLLEAWSRRESELIRAGASLLIAGPSLDLDRLSRWRSTLRSPERVLVGGEIPPGAVAAHMRGADAILVPSLEEGLPNVATEAAACARPVFASRVGGCGEVVTDGETGVLLPPEDAEAWSEALVRYAARPEELIRMGRNARARAEAFFDRESYATQMLNLYSAAINELE